MSDRWVEVEVRADGNFIVEDGDVHSPDEEETWFTKCWCPDDRHRGVQGMLPEMFPDVEPHLVGITKYTLYWKASK